ncbi:SpoIIE family protein phosphatase [Leptospira ognonensis]|nr:SpoIIE family protein phosphatase [Leptospira ognonensis]
MVFVKKLVSLLSMSLVGFLFACHSDYIVPEATKGSLDVVKAFEKNQATVPLKGEWQYYPELLVFPKDVSLIDSLGPTQYFTVPGTWTGSFLERGFLAGDGFGSFRLLVKHNLKNQSLSLRVPEMETAYLLFVEGKLVSKNGIVSPIEINSRPQYRPFVVDFIPENDESEFILLISNYHHKKGGPGQVISLGRTQAIHAKYEKEILKDMLLVGSIFFMGIYHLFLYLNRKKDPYTYWFALTCILISLRVFITGNKYLIALIPSIPWELHLKLSYLSFFLIPPVFCRYIFLTFTAYFPKTLYKVFFNIGLAVCMLILLTQSSFYTYLMIPYQIFTLTGATIGVVVVLRAIKAKQTGSRLFMLSFVLFLVTMINDFLVTNLVIYNPLLSHYGIFMMFIFQSISIARNFSRGFVEAETFAKQLSIRNKDLEEVRSQLTHLNESLELKANEKTIELQAKLDQINKDMKLAKSIVTGLTIVPDLSPFLEIDTIYQPIADVGGDIFFVKKIQDGYVRIFLGDATGHGLQAALYTMMIQSEFERLNMVATKPNDLLYYLNQHFYDKNSDLQIYFPAVTIDFDFSQSVLRFAAAGMQNQLLHKANGELVLLENTGPIIGILEQYRFGFQEEKVAAGDRIFLFTDGVFEELNENDGVAALGQLTDIIVSTRSLDFEDVTIHIRAKLIEVLQKSTWKDDATLIVLEVGSYLK